MVDEKAGVTVTGTVKWFNSREGYGFVTNPHGPDILLHTDVLREFELGCVQEGSEVQLTVVDTPRGMQAERVISILPLQNDSRPARGVIRHPTSEQIAACPILPARIKWFNRVRGFGFARAFGQGDDVYIDIEALRRSDFTELATGEAVAIRVMPSENGRKAVAILPWDVGVTDIELV
ncbi:cold shock protein (beta-ribbon, CspA family) [Loktanella atrilutea]|uniref:Cold shock protein (Beta-ribbon, CspA family) n=1 Tax=Loktanella atrilutea TaxID=366533 RepID=A0A1M5DLN1_LOKAT|nr:cold shock domain-containing protein [Loktanella atrilutea]SHF67909.1 cold shock protein (beta-ribbon, CspA family) [Loktanella atrilutea]